MSEDLTSEEVLITVRLAYRKASEVHRVAVVAEAEAFVRFRALAKSDGQAERMATIETGARTITTAAELVIAEHNLRRA